MKYPWKKMVGLAGSAVWLLSGCGGGASSVGDSDLHIGYLVDSAIEGVDFNGSMGSYGVTDATGTFHFKTGEKIRFSLGEHSLGEVPLAGHGDGVVVTPVDLVRKKVDTVQPADLNDPRVVAMLQMLQTADANQNPADGITISEVSKAALGEVPQTAGEDEIAKVLQRPVVSAEDAKTHFEKTLKELGKTAGKGESDMTDAESSETGDGAGDAASSALSDSDASSEDHGDGPGVNDGGSDEDNHETFSDGDGMYDNVSSTASTSEENGDEHKSDEEENDDDHNGDVPDNSSEQSQSSSGSSGTGGGTTPPVSGGSGSYTLLAWNDLGMHCMDGRDFSVFSILPPYNTLNAQLIKKAGTSNKHVTSGVTITYTAAPSLAGKYNTTSLQDNSNNPKTNFWDYVGSLFNANPAPDTGLTGNPVPSLTEQTLSYNATHRWWEATGIPLTPYNDDGSKNYYPMVNVTAKDASGNVLATTKVVLPVSDEMDCRACHGSTSGYADARPSAGWENDPDAEKDFKYNILRLHDQKFPTAVSDNLSALKSAGYNGYDSAGLYASAKAGNPVLCATCHASNALPGTGIAGIKPLTESLHSLHANVTDPTNGKTLASSANRSACYRCHPGATTKCLRGAMGKQSNIQCQSCHGSMKAVGAHGRKGWLDEPNCQACHQNGKRYTTAVTNSATGTLRSALDTRFATKANTPMAGVSLYRFSTGHGKMQCSACHGSTHAIFPSSHSEDNLQSIAVQGHAGTIAECTACHDTVPRTSSGGPHGMHSVGQYWVGAHEDVAERNSAQCKSCHGADYRGSDLSKTFSARTFSTEWGTKRFSAGHAVSCYDCHNGPGGD